LKKPAQVAFSSNTVWAILLDFNIPVRIGNGCYHQHNYTKRQICDMIIREDMRRNTAHIWSNKTMKKILFICHGRIYRA